MSNDNRFMELWPELPPGEIFILADMIDGRNSIRGNWPGLAEVGLLTSSCGVPTEMAHSFIRWARATDRLKADLGA